MSGVKINDFNLWLSSVEVYNKKQGVTEYIDQRIVVADDHDKAVAKLADYYKETDDYRYRIVNLKESI